MYKSAKLVRHCHFAFCAPYSSANIIQVVVYQLLIQNITIVYQLMITNGRKSNLAIRSMLNLNLVTV